uniref:lysophosphatidic acid receptor 1-A-like n=1 Tax=Myxine glutinosa TaxID=7769 RepID=UPI00358FFFD0
MDACHYHENISYFYDQVGKHLASTWEPLYVALLIIGIPLSLFISFANFLVVVAVHLNQRFHMPIYYLIANLAAADCFAGISYLFSLANTGPNTRLMSKATWFLRQSLIDISLSASVANLLAIAWERHFTISGMQLQSQMSTRRVVVVIIIIWIIAIFMGTLPIYWNCICDLKTCSNMAPMYSNNYILFWAISNLLTMLFMVVLYMRIFLHVQGHVHRMSRHTVSSNIQQSIIIIVKTVTMVLGAFVLCWMPGMVILLIDVLCPKQICNLHYAEKICLMLALSNSAINPIIYSCRDRELLTTLGRLLCCRKHKPIDQIVGTRCTRQNTELLVLKNEFSA